MPTKAELDLERLCRQQRVDRALPLVHVVAPFSGRLGITCRSRLRRTRVLRGHLALLPKQLAQGLLQLSKLLAQAVDLLL